MRFSYLSADQCNTELERHLGGAIRNVPEGDLDPLLGIACPTVIYPYVRETISDLVTRGGFPPVLLAPVSFEALYAQRAQQQSAAPKIEIAS